MHALGNVLGIHYDRAHAIMRACGRADRKGAHANMNLILTKINESDQKWEAHNVEFWTSNNKGMTLSQFVACNPKGRFYVVIRKHAFALVDGLIIDNNYIKPRAKIISAIRFTPVHLNSNCSDSAQLSPSAVASSTVG